MNVASGNDNGATITKEGMNGCSTDSKDEQNGMFDKLKRAALTTLSAAAVKAKLLADQQEDQILELVSLLIEKQVEQMALFCILHFRDKSYIVDYCIAVA